MLNAKVKISKNDFIFCKVVGRGSFGKVYLVKKKDKPETPLALKVLSKDVVAGRNLLIKTQGTYNFCGLNSFLCLAERDILEKIDSPFIVKLHYAFQTDAKLYFVMDFLNGGELFFHLRKETKFSERRACFYAAQLVEAIRCLHTNGVIYRDLKPENVLLDSNGNLKITDFGLSKQGVETDPDSEQKTFSFCGTPEYLAPEII
jgi:serum/glucocorticoid-regulated kinase 2